MEQNSAGSDRHTQSLTERFVQGTFWTLAGNVGLRLATFLSMVICARILGKVVFGELGVIQRTIEFVVVFSSFGVGLTTTKYVAELREQDPLRAGRIISLTYMVAWVSGGLMALACIMAAPWLAAETINAPHLSPELQLAGLVLLISSVYRLQNGILAGLQAFKAIARINFWEGVFTLPVITLLAWRSGLWGLILALNLIALWRVVISSVALGREYRSFGIRLDFRQAWKEHQVIWHYSLPYLLSSSLITAVNWGVFAILANQPGGYAQIGLYNAGMQFQWMITFFNMIMYQVSMPMLSELHGSGQMEQFARSFNSYLRLNWHLALAGGFLCLGLSPLLVRIFGSQFADSGPILGIIICATVLTVVWNINGQPFYSSGKMWQNLGIQIFWGAILLIGGKVFIPLYGAMGLALTFVSANVLGILLQMFLLYFHFEKLLLSQISLLCIMSVFLFLSSYVEIIYNEYYIQNIFFVLISMGLLIYIFRANIDVIKPIIVNLSNRFSFRQRFLR